MSKYLRAIVADIIDPKVRAPRGRRKGSHLDHCWHEIGHDFDKLLEQGVPKEKAYSALADEYGVGDRTVRNMIADYYRIIGEAGSARSMRNRG